MTSDLPDEVRSILDTRFAAREAVFALSRKAIRSAANSIRALHRSELDVADSLIAETAERFGLITMTLRDHPELMCHTVVSDAAKEYAEASITRAVFTGTPIPGFGDLGIDPVPYLHGLGEAVGEMRRRMLDLLRDEQLEEAGALLARMDEFVDMLAEVDYPDGMTNGLRRTTDVSRSLVERSRSDLTATVVQDRLRRDLKG